MSALTIFLFFLLCLSMHACNARCLKETAKAKQGHLFAKEVDQAGFHEIPDRQGLGHVDDRKIHENGEDENSMKREKSKPFFKGEASKGNKIIITSPNDLQRQAKTEPLKSSQGRSMLGYSSPNNTDEVVDSKENDAVEDFVVMDYAQPHRKPPIHNEKP